ncbi:MAG: thioredoxin TrxC [Gammaproteobacteria bacterium]
MTAAMVQVVCEHCDAANRVPSARLTERPRCGACKQPLFSGHPIALTASNFQKHASRSDIPLVVDFWAPWCGPCRSMAPAFEAAAARLEPHARLAKVNTDEEATLATAHGIRGIPTLAIFRGGREIARTSGAMPLETLIGWVRDSTR